MKFTCLKVVLFGLMLSSSWHANSNIISYYGYERNGNVVSKDGVEWLQWSETAGDSISDAMSMYSSDGWTVATFSQVNGLFSDFGFDTSEYAGEWVETLEAGSTREETAYDKFVELFGRTQYKTGSSYGRGPWAKEVARAIYGDILDPNEFVGLLSINSDWSYGRVIREDRALMRTGGYAGFRNEVERTFTSSKDYEGVVLVRSTSVNEPSHLAILALGIMCLVLRRFKKQS